MAYNNNMMSKNLEDKQVQDRIIMDQINQKNLNKKDAIIKGQIKNKDKGQISQRQGDNKIMSN